MKELIESAKRILMTADTIGGVWTYALELIAALGKHGIEVSLATMGAPMNSRQREEAGKISNLEVFESNFKLEWMEDPWEDVRQAGEWLLDMEKRLKPDVVHLNGYVHAALPWRSPTLVVGHSCVLSWWEAVKGEAAPASWERYRVEVQKGLQATNVVIAPSSAMLAALHRHYGAIANSRIIPNGRNSAIFYPSEKQELVLTAGRLWDEAKNVAALEAIASIVRWSIYIAGEDKHPTYIKPRRREDAKEGGVVRLGRLSTEELAKWYAQAAIYALPARYEPFGLSVLEAALSGCALVVGDIPSLREIWGDAAVYVMPDDREALASAINTLITDAPRRHQLAKMARDRALEFTPQRMAAAYLETYQDLLSKWAEIN